MIFGLIMVEGDRVALLTTKLILPGLYYKRRRLHWSARIRVG